LHIFGAECGRRVVGIGGAEASGYAPGRQKEGAASGTINRELAVLGKMLRLVCENGKLVRLSSASSRRLRRGAAPAVGRAAYSTGTTS